MLTRSRFETWYGRDEPPAELRELRAGPLTVQLDAGDLRYVRLGDVELVRRLYAAVRDPNWGTVPVQLSNFDVEEGPDRFSVRFDAHHEQGAIDYAWQGTITGSPDGTIVYAMDGVARRDFRHNKIGLNIHHPFAACAGRPYRAETPDGPIEGELPLLIGPQLIVEDIDVPLFSPFSRLTIEQDGAEVTFDFQGALAEMEDQRNWTDASFKTYMPPQMRGFPYPEQSGRRFQQSITVSFKPLPRSHDVVKQEHTIEVGAPARGALPSLGLGMAKHGGELTSREINLLRRLQLDHLRVDLHLNDSGYSAEFERAVRAAQALDCSLELAVFVDGDGESQLEEFSRLLEAPPVRVTHVLVFAEGEEATLGPLAHRARQRLHRILPGVPVGGGTNVYFNELNRNRPDTEALDMVAYSVNPQIHAFDELSMAEALEGQAETVKSARAFSDDLPVAVSPVTLRPRFNAVATEEGAEAVTNQLPWEVDRRQISLFGAAWTVGSIKYLAESGAGSATYYETTGWRGVMETETGSPLPELFPSEPGAVFPLYHVFADLGEWKGGRLMACRSERPLSVVGLAVQSGDRLHLLIANLTARANEVTVGPLQADEVAVRSLDESSVQTAVRDPGIFRAQYERQAVEGGALRIALQPYAVVRVDV
jgi:D-apionolactonase